MPLVNPNIAMSFRPIELQMPNALAQAAQIEQIQAARRQNEVGQMQLEQMRRDEETLKQIQAKAVEHGGPSDLGQIADAYIKSGNPKFVEFGIGLRQKLDDRANFERILGGGAPAAPAAPAAAPNAFVRPTAPAIGALGTGTFGMAPEPVNQLVPAAAPAAPVNQLAPDNAAELARLKARRDALLFSSDPRAAAAIRSAEADIARLEKEPTYQNVPGVGLVEPRTGRVVMAAKEPQPEIIRLQNAASQLPPGSPERRQLEGRIDRLIKGTEATRVEVKLPEQEKAFEGALGKKQAEKLIEDKSAAEDARAIISSIQEGRKLLKAGVITGAAAEFLTSFGAVLNQAGINFAEDKVANTQAFAANMASNVGRIIKQFGAGTGLSNADREYAEKMAGGKITLDRKSIERIMDINERAARNAIALHNKNAAGVRTNIPLTVEPPPAEPAAETTVTPRGKPTLDQLFGPQPQR